MILSTQTSTLAGTFGDLEAIKIIAQNGFEAADYSMFGMENREHFLNTPEAFEHIGNVKKKADECGIFINQTHAPFPSYKKDNEEYNQNIIPILKKAIIFSSLLGAKIVIVHPITSEDNQLEKNINLYSSLAPTAIEYNVKIALENMWSYNSAEKKITHAACSTAEQFNQYIDTLNGLFPETFTACLDLGHCGLVGINAFDMIRGMGNRITSLHVHDNNNYDDSHTIPYLGKINWDETMKALCDIGYSGEFTFESDHYIASFPPELRAEASKYMEKVGRFLLSKMQNK